MKIANNSEYGLSGGVWTADKAKALEVTRQLRTGGVPVNGVFPDLGAPFGEYKQIGIGREFGSEGVNHYVEHKAISL